MVLLEKELLPSQIPSLQRTENLAPAAKHFIMVLISNSVGQVRSVVSTLGLREERGEEERERDREKPSKQQGKLVSSWDSWPPANMATSTGCHLPGGKVDGFCLNSPQNPRWGCVEIFQEL